MTCAWQCFVNILPLWLRNSVDKLGKDDLLELRLRLNLPPILRSKHRIIALERNVSADDLHFCINTASRYSPWLADTAARGYITAEGGHRIGLCGNAAGLAGSITDLSGVTSLCLRVARDFPGVAKDIPTNSGSVLILGSPGSGKTTLLRDLIRTRSQTGACVSVVDERGEIFPRVNGKFCFEIGLNTDVLSGCKKIEGIDAVLRAMGPDIIAVDEITEKEDCSAMLQAGWCGVKIIATIHAEHKSDLFAKPLCQTLMQCKLFNTLVILNRDKSYTVERLDI